MNILDIIAKKRDGKVLNKSDIDFFVTEYTSGNINDYQAAALIMAIYINGMNAEETANLTLAMAHSGEILDLSELGIVVDKHSTGGVGDKITLILMPIVASLGIPVAKMSGRGLGFTGGTVDKLESIPGYQTDISIDKFKESVENVGISLIGQTGNLAPADKKIYALRDAVNCVESIPLIASSIMSKKIAAGASKIVIDVTYGSGAFMKDDYKAEELAQVMENIGKLTNRQVVCRLTDMDQPLGYAVGNTLEVIEAIDILKGKYMPPDVEKVLKILGAPMLQLAGLVDSEEEGANKIMESIRNGSGYSKLASLVENQGGDISYLENTDKFEKAKIIAPILADKTGKVARLDALQVGELAKYLGAGRINKEDKIDAKVGFVFNKKVGDEVTKGEVLGYVHADDEEKAKKVLGTKIYIIG